MRCATLNQANEQNTRISKLEEELGGMHKENQSEEEGLRKRKTKLMNEVKTCLNSYDAALTAKQDEIDEVRVRAALLVVCFHTPFGPRCLTLRRVTSCAPQSLYEAEKKRLAELTEHFRRIDRNLARQAEEEAAWKAVHDVRAVCQAHPTRHSYMYHRFHALTCGCVPQHEQKKMAEETNRLGGAASKIQAHWKGFTTRREMTTKKKGKVCGATCGKCWLVIRASQLCTRVVVPRARRARRARRERKSSVCVRMGEQRTTPIVFHYQSTTTGITHPSRCPDHFLPTGCRRRRHHRWLALSVPALVVGLLGRHHHQGQLSRPSEQYSPPFPHDHCLWL